MSSIPTMRDGLTRVVHVVAWFKLPDGTKAKAPRRVCSGHWAAYWTQRPLAAVTCPTCRGSAQYKRLAAAS